MDLRSKYRNIFPLAIAFVAASPAMRADVLEEGREAFMNYDFDRAAELYAQYAKTLKKRPNGDAEALLKKYERQLEIAENSLDNVQKIEVIERIDVPAESFFTAIKLPASGGSLLAPSQTPVKEWENESDFVFRNEAGDFAVWSAVNADGVSNIMESHKLTDGSWETPHNAGNVLNEGGDVRNPFMLSDGLTLYFSGDGEQSMGGYDIFVATKDPSTGEYRQPTGVGYPFNSPYNEYMVAIDEANGIGWWVTDRNQLDGKVSVYVFCTNEVRSNYDAEEEDDIVALARLDDISVTQNPDTDYAALAKDIDRRFHNNKTEKNEKFYFPMPGGKVYKELSDFSSPKARRSFAQYMSALEEQKKELAQLRALRMKYHKTDRKSGAAAAIGNQIKDLEKQTEWQREKLKKMRNTIISSELKN